MKISNLSSYPRTQQKGMRYAFSRGVLSYLTSEILIINFYQF